MKQREEYQKGVHYQGDYIRKRWEIERHRRKVTSLGEMSSISIYREVGCVHCAFPIFSPWRLTWESRLVQVDTCNSFLLQARLLEDRCYVPPYSHAKDK